jgi:acetoacetyl-CoA synthetase
MQNKILWTPSQKDVETSHLKKFIRHIEQQYDLKIPDYFSLHAWSVEYPETFWFEVAKFCEIKFSQAPEKIMISETKMQNTKWFEGAKLNFAENLLQRRDDHVAIIFSSENQSPITITYQELYKKTAQLANFFKTLGIKAGDCVAGFMPNCPETIIGMLAATSIGAIWTACSSDFGINALLDRFEQVQPKILLAADAHFYGGKSFNHLSTIAQLQKKLPSLIHTLIVPVLTTDPNITTLDQASLLPEIFNSSADEIDFVQLPFDHPIYILYSSGTTGKPKCMVHGAGRVLIQHLKELMLHSNLQKQDKIFFYTTCGWMMWNWLVSSLAVGASVVLYEGNPFYPTPARLFDLIDELGINIFGVGAKLIESAESRNLKPKLSHNLNSLGTILTTASPLLPESFDYIYHSIKKDVQVSSISGGSDIVSCFALGNPMLPVYRGELQCIGLGMNVKVFNGEGKSMVMEKGELVCASPFPSMPIYFWNDPTGEKYQAAYFEKYPGVWAHGDYAMITAHKSMVIFGRSDATLNPAGIRIGTAEIYNQVQKFSEIADCLAVGQFWKNSERIILFVVLQKNIDLTDALCQKIKKILRENASPHHVPAKIIAVKDLPRTISGKVMELTIKKIIHREPISNLETLANPESLEYFKNIPELNQD